MKDDPEFRPVAHISAQSSVSRKPRRRNLYLIIIFPEQVPMWCDHAPCMSCRSFKPLTHLSGPAAAATIHSPKKRKAAAAPPIHIDRSVSKCYIPTNYIYSTLVDGTSKSSNPFISVRAENVVYLFPHPTTYLACSSTFLFNFSLPCICMVDRTACASNFYQSILWAGS
jgi:hypothetical protein